MTDILIWPAHDFVLRRPSGGLVVRIRERLKPTGV